MKLLKLLESTQLFAAMAPRGSNISQQASVNFDRESKSLPFS